MTRQLFILTVFLTVTACSLFGQVKKDTIYSSDTMTIRTYKKDGKLNWEDNYVKGKLVSVKYWYYNKDVFGYFITDKRKTKPKIEYRKEFYLDGKLKVEGTTTNGKKNGKYKTYYQNGHSQCDCNYNNGQQDSIQTVHFESGQVSLITNYKNGKQDGKTTYYFDNGQIWTEKIYKNGKLWTVLSNFDKKGNPMEKGTLKDGNGTLYLYDENGKLTDIEHYKDGKLTKTDKK